MQIKKWHQLEVMLSVTVYPHVYVVARVET
jgi:hypothetical protein